MTNSWKLGAVAALCASAVFIGCGDDDDGGGGDGSAGASSGSAGKATGGTSSGQTNGGNSSGGKAGAGNAGTTSGGKAGAGNAGNDSGGQAGGGNAGEGGVAQGGAGGEPNAVECSDDDLGAGGAGEGGAGGAAAAATTAVVLIDSVSVDKGAENVANWTFEDGTTISDATDYPADRWSRIVFDAGSLGGKPGAHLSYLGCDGDPKPGSLKAVVPFSDLNQYCELGVPFAAADFSNTKLTARVKLVSGGKPEAACPVRGELYITGNGGANKTGPALPLVEGEWITLELELEAGFATTDRVGVRFNTYGC